MKHFHDLPPFGFGFDIYKPAGLRIRYQFRICNIIGQFDSWTSGKLSVGSVTILRLQNPVTNPKSIYQLALFLD